MLKKEPGNSERIIFIQDPYRKIGEFLVVQALGCNEDFLLFFLILSTVTCKCSCSDIMYGFV